MNTQMHTHNMDSRSFFGSNCMMTSHIIASLFMSSNSSTAIPTMSPPMVQPYNTIPFQNEKPVIWCRLVKLYNVVHLDLLCRDVGIIGKTLHAKAHSQLMHRPRHCAETVESDLAVDQLETTGAIEVVASTDNHPAGWRAEFAEDFDGKQGFATMIRIFHVNFPGCDWTILINIEHIEPRIIPKTSSATALAFWPGVFMATTLLASHAFRSMLS